MGTLAAGIKEIFATAKTTGSNVMLCGNDGTPYGHMTMANLASVLGGLGTPVLLGSSDNLNTIFADNTVKTYYTIDTSNPTGLPNAAEIYNTLIFVYRHGNQSRTLQVLYSFNNKGLWYRSNSKNKVNNWSDWMQLSYDIPSFYKNYADLSSLANALGVITKNFNWFHDSTYNADNFTNIGACPYIDNNGGLNVLLNIAFNQANVVQFKVNFHTNSASSIGIDSVKVRCWHEEHGWSQYKTISIS